MSIKEFELRALHLLVRYLITWAQFTSGYVLDRVSHICPGLAWIIWPFYLCPLHSRDYMQARHISPLG
jgi:hypothetical protein